MEVFRSRLDTVLGSQLWVALLEQGVGADDLQRCLQPQPACDLAKVAHSAAGIAEIQICKAGFCPSSLKKDLSLEADTGRPGADADRTFSGN